MSSSPIRVAGFSAYPWDHSITLLRLVEPIIQAGMKFYKGNDYDCVYPEQISNADLIVIQREFPRWRKAYETVVSQAFEGGKPIVYEIDDLLLELPQEHPDRPNHYYTRALFPMLRAISEADAVTASTPALCSYLRPFNPNTWLLPNYLIDKFWQIADAGGECDSGPATIGYMGSSSHAPDLALLTPVFQQLLDSYEDDIRIKFWGGEPPPEIRHYPQVEWIPLEMSNYADFAAYFSKQECDIFIAPLANNQFNRSKSSIKFFEYSALAVPGVYSRIQPYESVIDQGNNGFLASGLSEWLEHLSALIENPDLRRSIGVEARQTVQQDWLLSTHAHEWREVYKKVLEQPAETRLARRENALSLQRISIQVQDWQTEMEDQMLDLEGSVQNLQNKLDEREHAAELVETLNTTIAGRLTMFCWKLNRAIIPPGSSRENLLRSVYRRIKGLP